MDGEGRNGFIQGQQSQELLQLQQQPQRCPRCDSLNTKFCYFNNYSQSQPRYFCKACRRYWTQGGTLRNVPIGGSCRKGKRARVASSSGEAVRSLAAAPIAPAPNQPSPAPLQPAQLQATLTSASPNVVPSNPVLGIRESGPTVPAFGVAPTMHMASYYPGENGYLSSLLSDTKSLSVGSNAAGTSNFSAMPGFDVQPFSYEQQQQQRQIREEQFYQMDNRERSIGAMYPRQHGLLQSGMPAGGSAYQLYLSQNFMNDANHSGSVSNASAGSSLDPNQSPRMPEYDPSP